MFAIENVDATGRPVAVIGSVDSDRGGEGRMLWWLVGAVISVTLVSDYIVLAVATLAVRAVLGLAAEGWRWLLPRNVRDAVTPGAEAA